jgi:hypothetical protein
MQQLRDSFQLEELPNVVFEANVIEVMVPAVVCDHIRSPLDRVRLSS